MLLEWYLHHSEVLLKVIIHTGQFCMFLCKSISSLSRSILILHCNIQQIKIIKLMQFVTMRERREGRERRVRGREKSRWRSRGGRRWEGERRKGEESQDRYITNKQDVNANLQLQKRSYKLPRCIKRWNYQQVKQSSQQSTSLTETMK